MNLVGFPAGPCIHLVEDKLLVPIRPEFEMVPQTGILRHLWEARLAYHPQLGGYLLGWQVDKNKLRRKSSPPLRSEHSVKGTFTVFKPEPGQVLRGRVVEVRGNCVIANTYDIFMVRLEDPGKGMGVVPGDQIRYTMQDFYVQGSDCPVIVGSDASKLEIGELTLEEKTEPASDVVSKPAADTSTAAEPTTEETLTGLEGFPAGWQRVKHQKAGGKPWYTFAAPDGTKYKSLKLAKSALEGSVPSNRAQDFPTPQQIGAQLREIELRAVEEHLLKYA